MKILTLQQGSDSWHAHRARAWNASEAAMMLGVSPYLSRSALLRWRATGVAPEWDEATLRAFAEGHRCEALARPIAEKIVDEDLYPCVGVIEGTKYSASLDGMTLGGETLFEHKLLNVELRAAISDDGRTLPEYHRIQMEQQLMVSKAERVLFMASEWEGDRLVDERHCWYFKDIELRARIVSGWQQFEHDLANYIEPAPLAPPAVGRAPETLPALRIELTGMVTASNLAEFKDHAIAVFKGIRTDLQTDQDFADAEKTVKWCGDIEDRLKAAKDHALSQTASIDELFRAIDAISAEARNKRLELDKLVKARKEEIRADIVRNGHTKIAAHYAEINATLYEHALSVPPHLVGELGAAIKGKKTLASITDAVDVAVMNAKIAASQTAERVRACIAALTAASAGFESLFPDRVALCASKMPEDIRNLAAARIAEHQKLEEAKRVEAARAAEQARGQFPPAAAKPLDPNAGETIPIRPDVNGRADGFPAAGGSRIKLGDINAAIAPLTITADGLATLGFKSVGTERAAKLYDANDFTPICRKLIERLDAAAKRGIGRAAA